MLLGLSPCPNDTYIFHALLHNLVRPDFPQDVAFEPVFADVERLNAKALTGELPVTKVSAGVLPHILDKYAILSAGAALGWGCGPLVIARDNNFDIKTASVAIPGKHTTAARLLELEGGFSGPKREILFSEIMPAVARGDVDLGVIIHEGRFTYRERGFAKIIDLGEWWEQKFHLPLPLGAIVARRDLAPGLALAIQEAIAASVRYANANPDASAAFVAARAQEIDERVARAHIKTFVTEYSVDLGETGGKAIERFLDCCPAMKNGKDIFLKR